MRALSEIIEANRLAEEKEKVRTRIDRGLTFHEMKKRAAQTEDEYRQGGPTNCAWCHGTGIKSTVSRDQVIKCSFCQGTGKNE